MIISDICQKKISEGESGCQDPENADESVLCRKTRAFSRWEIGEIAVRAGL